MTRKKLSLSAKLAGKRLVGFDTSAWDEARAAKDAGVVDAKCGGKPTVAPKIGGKVGAKSPIRGNVETKIGTKLARV